MLPRHCDLRARARPMGRAQRERARNIRGDRMIPGGVTHDTVNYIPLDIKAARLRTWYTY